MSWVTIDEAVKIRGSKASWKRWISSGTVPTKLEAGRRLVWLTIEPLERIAFELERHREERLRWAQIIADQGEENEKLRAELLRLKDKLAKQESWIAKTRKSNSSNYRGSNSKRILPARHAELLRMVEESQMTMRDIEARAGLAKRFLTKAKLGQRNGPRSDRSWEKLEDFFKTLYLKTA